ncbi:MAG: DegT/DnrJ/EryC1/StrS family aminotransferase [Nitrospiraceae bacterium]|nr:MAG: DegT/DnrJ/EryC1/StrS family aminotransferase [Nitrospiraceae bacterium]
MNFVDTYISRKAIELATAVLESGYVTAGKYADKFEEELEIRLGLINPVTLNSGTSALYLALAVAGIKPGDEVIIPPQTFIATGLAVMMHYAVPVFADIQYDTANIAPDSIRKKITEKTRAIIPVHWGGYPCDLDEINAIAKEHGLAVIEDAAHALGAVYKGRPVGAISRFTALSFQAIKHVTTVDGGALCCLNEDDYYHAKRRRWFDIDRENAKPSVLGEREYDATDVGYKCHMNDLTAAIGIGNLYDFPSMLKRRHEIAGRYRTALKGVSGISLLGYKDDRTCAYWLFTMLVERREDFIRALKSRGVPASVVHLRIDNNSVFGGTRPDLVNQARFDENQVSVPVHNGLTDEDVSLVIESVKKGW